MFKMLIVDDEYIVRTGIRETVDWESYGVTVVGEASDGTQGLKLIEEKKPDIVLTDVRMQTLGGLELLKQIKEKDVDCEVIIISGYEDFDYVREALKNGAFSYLVKPVDNNELVETVLSACKKLAKNRHTQKYFERLSGELNSIKRQFLRELLSGTIINEKALADNLEFYEINVEIGPAVATYFRIEEAGLENIITTPERQKSLSNKLGEIINEYAFQKIEKKAIFLQLSENEFAAIINIDEDYNINFMRAVFKESANQFESAMGRNLSIGIGDRVRKLVQISTSFQNAKKCFQGKIKLKGLNNILAFEDINNLGYKKEIQEAIRYICENYANSITVESVASELYISASYLMHLFKDEIGKTFNECLTEYRIITAKELLSLNKYKIYEVSNMVGYKDVKYFSQIFKKYCGVTPSEYSKSI